GLQTVLMADPQDGIPNRFEALSGCDDFKTVFAGVAGPSQVKLCSTKLKSAHLIFLQLARLGYPCSALARAGKTLIDEFGDARPLERHRAQLVRSILELNVRLLRPTVELFFQPDQIRPNAGCIDDQEVFIRTGAIGIEIVKGAA